MGKRTIGILECGLPPVEVIERWGPMVISFERLSVMILPRVRGTPERVLRDIYDCDGWLITGSKHGVYEDHAWIPPLRCFAPCREYGIPLYGSVLVIRLWLKPWWACRKVPGRLALPSRV